MNAKILLIEVDSQARQDFAGALREKNYAVSTAKDGPTGVRIFNKIFPDLVISNLVLGEMTAVEICEKIRKTPQGPKTRIILVSNTKRSQKYIDGISQKYHLSKFLQKPFSPEDLLGVVQETLGANGQPNATPTLASPRTSAPTPSENPGGPIDKYFPVILLHFQKTQATGILILQKEKHLKKVFFKAGKPVGVESNVKEEQMGKILVSKGVIAEQDYLKAAQLILEENIQMGEALIRLKCLEKEVLEDLIEEHQITKIANCFLWIDAQITFQKLNALPEIKNEKEISVEKIFKLAVATLKKTPKLGQILLPVHEEFVTLLPQFNSQQNLFQFNEKELAITEKLNGCYLLKELIDENSETFLATTYLTGMLVPAKPNVEGLSKRIAELKSHGGKDQEKLAQELKENNERLERAIQERIEIEEKAKAEIKEKEIRAKNLENEKSQLSKTLESEKEKIHSLEEELAKLREQFYQAKKNQEEAESKAQEKVFAEVEKESVSQERDQLRHKVQELTEMVEQLKAKKTTDDPLTAPPTSLPAPETADDGLDFFADLPSLEEAIPADPAPMEASIFEAPPQAMGSPEKPTDNQEVDVKPEQDLVADSSNSNLFEAPAADVSNIDLPDIDLSALESPTPPSPEETMVFDSPAQQAEFISSPMISLEGETEAGSLDLSESTPETAIKEPQEMGLDMDSDIFDLAGDLEMDSQSAVAPNADSTIVFEAPCADSFAQPSDGEKAEQSIWSEEEPSQDDNPLGGDDLDQDLLDAFDQIKQSEDETPKAATPSSDPPKSILPVDPFAPASIRTEEVSASGLGLSGAEKKVDDAAKTAEEDAFEDFFQMPDK